jgi:uncharacterized damage-inducible protein DinB
VNGSVLEDAFGHHVWATLRLIDACLPLTEEQLDTNVPGTYGSIIDTMRHIVGGDYSYLSVITDGRVENIDDEHERRMGLAELRTAMEATGAPWSDLLAQEIDPDAIVVRHRDDGSESRAALGIRLAQVVHHGTDHRSQICTALTTLGIEPPAIDVWAYGADNGRVESTDPPAQS